MSSNVVNQSNLLRVARQFPIEPKQLQVELNKSYIDIANAVNQRTIGVFPTTRPAITGDTWIISGNQRQNSFRQVYSISSSAAFPHGINFNEVFFFTVIRGIGFDGTNYYPIPYVSPVAAADSMGIFVDATNVNITTGAGSPALSSALIILEWLSNP